MSGFKGIVKGGYHPRSKDGKGTESWRGDFKGVNTVAGWVGKGKDTSGNTAAHEHVSRPLATLKDPSAFGPPPKNVNYHGGAAMPNQITPDTRGLGAPLSREEIQAKREEEQRLAEEEAKPKGPPVPFRSDTTGLKTTHLPPPPGRKDGADGRSPALETKPKAKPPGLPPRLPPRDSSAPTSPVHTGRSEPDAHKGILNQGALSRLGAAGVSVPGFGIGSRQQLPPPTISPSRTPQPASPANSSQLNELSSRFSRLSSTTSPKPDSPSQGTTWAEKQAAMKTASSFHKDPSSISFSDAKAAAGTANNFRERHGEQVKSGWQSANKLNTKYGLADKVGAYGGGAQSQPPEAGASSHETPSALSLGALGKKKPPPPPVKRAGLGGAASLRDAAPPSIPMSSRPDL